MKSILLLVSLLAGPSLKFCVSEGISAADRKFAVQEFQRTKQKFLNDVKGLSEQQLQFKSDTSRWSIAQCIEHIALAESALWQWEQGTVSQPASSGQAAEVKITDAQMLQQVTDRSHKFTAPEMLQPVGKFAGTDAAITAFTKRRDSTIGYINTTNDDLRNHFASHPAFGTMNAYQLLLLLAGHSERHTLQIEEVKASPGFPKS